MGNTEKTSDQFQRERIEIVKRKLWQFGYSAREVGDIPGIDYDLLVERTYKVKVHDPKKDTSMTEWPNTLAIADEDGVTFMIPQKRNQWTFESSPLKAFPRVKEITSQE